MLKRLTGKGGASTENRANKGRTSSPEHYNTEKQKAHSGDTKKRLTLAANTKTHQEILYYLAENDPSQDVRKAVAENTSTPLQAARILAEDEDSDVRIALAERLLALLPDLSSDEQSHLYAFAVQALSTLALDEVLKVRIALAETLKDHAHAPPDLAAQLARDIERQVSEPVLRFCAALKDEDLLDILGQHPESWAIQAIAGREGVSADVSKAVIDTGDIQAGEILIANEGAQITKDMLEDIVEKARRTPEWHHSVAARKNFPPKLAQELAEFVDESVRNLLVNRGDFDQQTIDEIMDVVHRRMDYAVHYSDEKPSARAKRLHKKGELDDEVLGDALAMRDYDFVSTGLACLSGAPQDDIDKIMDMKAPKAVVAICWKAGLSMRMAFRIQQEMARISHKELVYPRDGTDYPLETDELNWQLEFLGLKAA
jgi:uncharacterized protein (DUF2336 family)